MLVELLSLKLNAHCSSPAASVLTRAVPDIAKPPSLVFIMFQPCLHRNAASIACRPMYPS